MKTIFECLGKQTGLKWLTFLLLLSTHTNLIGATVINPLQILSTQNQLKSIFRYIENHPIQGMYRVSGNKLQEEDYLNKLKNLSLNIVELQQRGNVDVIALCAALKKYIGGSNLIDDSLFSSAFLYGSKVDNGISREKFVNFIKEKITNVTVNPRGALLVTLFEHLHNLASKEEIVQKTFMNAHNLGLMFGPRLLPQEKFEELGLKSDKLLDVIPAATNFVETAIETYPDWAPRNN